MSGGATGTHTTGVGGARRSGATATGIGLFIGAVLTFTVFMYGLSEILADRIPSLSALK